MSSSISSSRFGWWSLASVGLGLALFAGFVGASEALVRYRVEPNDHFWKHVDLFLTSQSSNAVFGDSIAARGVIGASGFVNLAQPGEAPNVTRLKIESYFKTRRPDKVVIALNPNFMKRPERDTRGFEDILSRRNESLFSVLKLHHRERMFGYWTTWLSKGAFDTNVEVLDGGGIRPRVNAENFEFARKSPQARREEALRNMIRDVPPVDFRNGSNLQLLRGVLDFLRQRGGNVCLVGFPFSADYRRAADERKDFAELRALYRTFARERGVKFVDFWNEFSDDRLFLNGSHLNEEGGRKLAPLILQRCFQNDQARKYERDQYAEPSY